MNRWKHVLLVLALIIIAYGAYEITQRIEDDPQIVISIVSLVTAIAVLLSVSEMKRARNESYKPHIVCNFNSVYGYNKRETDTSYLPLIWSSEKLDEDTVIAYAKLDPKLYDPNRYSATIVNIGKGAAKEVHAEWKFDIEGSISVLEHHAAVNAFDIDIETIASDNYDIHFDKACHTIFLVTRDMNFGFDHILACTEPKYVSKILIPYAYIQLVSIIIRVGIGVNATLHSLRDMLPVLNLNLRYRDISGNKHSQQYSFRLYILGYTSSVTKKNVELFQGKIERIDQ